MSDYQYVNYSVQNGVARIALNTPDKLNAFHYQMRLDLMAAIERVEQDDDARVVILTGEGRAFSAGADLSDEEAETFNRLYPSFVEQCAAEYKPWLMGIHDSKKIYIAAVNGACAGIGTAAAMNCDLMIMGDDAYLYQAFAAIGLMQDGGATWLLLHKIGYQKAFELAVNAGKLTAQECLDLHITNKVVPEDELRGAAQAMGERLAQGAPLAQASIKTLMRKAHTMSYSEVVDVESEMQSKLITSEDSANAIAAFFNKEKPVFSGK